MPWSVGGPADMFRLQLSGNKDMVADPLQCCAGRTANEEEDQNHRERRRKRTEK